MVKPLVEGLGARASRQTFSSYDEALIDYLEARRKGLVKVVRLANDNDAQWGPVESAEDL